MTLDLSSFPDKAELLAMYFKTPADGKMEGPERFKQPLRPIRQLRHSAGERAFIIQMNESKLGVAAPMDRIVGRHPEQQDDEAYLCNYYLDELHHCGWATRRAGCYAYRLDGTLLLDLDYVPVFVKIDEVTKLGRQVVDGKVKTSVDAQEAES